MIDLDGHVVGVNPGRAFRLDHAFLATTIVQTAQRLGDLARYAVVEIVIVDGRDGWVALHPLNGGGLVVAGAAPKTLGLDELRRFTWSLRGAAVEATPLSIGKASVLHWSPNRRKRLLDAFRGILREHGCPESLIVNDSRRARLGLLLQQCCTGGQTVETRRVLATLCRRCGIAPVQTLLGTGSFGSVYELADGTALKLTRDDREARATATLAGRQLRRFPQVHRVFECFAWNRPLGCHGIWRQAVQHAGNLPGQMAEAGRQACDVLVALRHGRQLPEDSSGSTAGAAWRFAREFQAEMNAHGIVFGDYQPQNLGVAHGLLCFFDLSLANGPPVDIEGIDIGG